MTKRSKAAKKTNPKLGRLVDELFKLRMSRLAAEKVAAGLKSKEHELRQKLLKTIPRSELSGARGTVGAVNLIPDVYSRWAGEDGKERFLKYLRKTGNFDLIVFHINTAAAKERWDAKATIPGVVPEPYTKLSVTKA